MMHKKKGQAALEFLTTYAWAFLVILIMVGALAYFGVLKPSKLLPDRCNFGSEVACVDFAIDYGGGAAGIVNLRLTNNIGEAFIIPDVDADFLISAESGTAIACGSGVTVDGTASGSYTWASGDTIDVTFTGCNTAAIGFLQGEKGKVDFTVDYYLAKSSSTYEKRIAGEVFATVN